MQHTRLAAWKYLSHPSAKRSCQLWGACIPSYSLIFNNQRQLSLHQSSKELRNRDKKLDQAEGITNSDAGSKVSPRRIGRILLLGSLIGVGAISYNSIQSDPPREHAIFEKPRFTGFDVVDKEHTSSTAILITARPSNPNSSNTPPSFDPYKKSWEQGTWSVEFKQPQLQIARSYTPLPPVNDTESGDLRFYIRKEHKGEMSNYLYNLPVGARIEIRGPYPEIDLPQGVTDVVYLAGGTGIAPAFQVIHTLFEVQGRSDEGSMPNIRIIWANRRREDCVGAPKPAKRSWGTFLNKPNAIEQHAGTLVKELEDLRKKYGDHISVEYLVDEECSFLDEKKVLQLTQLSSRDRSESQQLVGGKKLLFVSGPEGFVRYFAGPKAWEGGREVQGELGGVIGQLKLGDWQVCKL
ncbi:hypothetical protein B7463_g9640, partial [Scytalidium lignicola]